MNYPKILFDLTYEQKMELDKKLIMELRPQFDYEELESLKTFALFDAKYHEVVSDKLRQHLKKDPVIGKIINSQTAPEQIKQDNKSRRLRNDAIYNGDWDAYTKNLILQGKKYAQSGLRLKDWFRIVQLYREYLQPFIVDEYPGDTKQASLIWKGTNSFMNYTLMVIAESYSLEKNKTIEKEHLLKEQTLKELRQNEEQLRAIYKNTTDIILKIDNKGIIQFINHIDSPFTKEEVIGTSVYDLHSNESSKNIKKAVQSVFKNKKPAIYQSRIETPEQTRYYSGSVAPIFEDGKVQGAAIISRDISDRKESELQIKELNETLEKKVEERTAALKAVNSELESFTYTVSHDLRAPLRAIDGFSKVLLKKLDGNLDTSQTRYLDIIIENVSRMGQLIDDLLSYSRMGRREKNEVGFSMEELVKQVYNELLQNSEKTSIELITDQLPYLKADREMMKQVISNLLGNAIKFSSKQAKPIVEVGAKEKADEIICYVKDNGAGFEMEYAHKLFTIFQRLHSDEEFEGTGVGLAIVQRIIHRHGGRVWAEGELDRGATFYFSLPKYNF